jgi:hypothetical protein
VCTGAAALAAAPENNWIADMMRKNLLKVLIIVKEMQILRTIKSLVLLL